MTGPAYTTLCERCGGTFRATAYNRARYCSDNCRKRACAERQRAHCVDCGEALQEGSVWKGVLRCVPCHQNLIAEQHRVRDEQIVSMWAAGMSMNQIAERLGWSKGHLAQEMNRVRARGYDLPYRRAPKDPANDRRFRKVAAE